MGAARKVMSATLLCWPMMLEADLVVSIELERHSTFGLTYIHLNLNLNLSYNLIMP